jgi:hypothetical protein
VLIGTPTSTVHTIPELALLCSACGCARDDRPAWCTYLVDAGDSSKSALSFCPECAEREFGQD